MTAEQIRRIEAYLETKKLSQPLLKEVESHFIAQIDAEMLEKNLNFESAFLNTRLAWQKDLQMVKADLFTFTKVTKLEKRLIQDQFKLIFRNAFVFAVIVSGFTVIFPDYFSYLLIAVFLTVLVFYVGAIAFRKITIFQMLQISFHPLLIRLFFINCAVAILGFGIIDMMSPNQFDIKNTIRDFTVFLGCGLQLQLLYFKIKKDKILV